MSSARPRRRRLVLTALGLLAALVAGALGLGVALRSESVNRALDRRTLRTIAAVALGRPIEPPTPASGPPREPAARSPLPFASAAGLEVLTRPEHPLVIETRPLTRHRRDEPELVQEELVFPSPLPVAHAASNQAHAYLYRRGPLGSRPLVLWVPGLYVVDLAFIPIGWFEDEILRRDADVLLYVPPYHLERTPPGFGSGDALLATTVPDQLTALAQELAELRGLVRWLKAHGAQRLGAFGGSLGGVMLLRLATWDDGLDFLTVMMPPLRLDHVLLGPPELAPVRARLTAAGWPLDALRDAYRSFDVTGDDLRVPRGRVAILAGLYDQIAPFAHLTDFARLVGIERVFAYRRGHALLLLQRHMYRDYGRVLDADLRAGP